MAAFHLAFGTSADTITWWQMCARAMVLVLYAIGLFRIASRRIFGRYTIVDIVVAVIIGSTLSRALTANAPLLPAVAASAAIVALHGLLTAWSARSRWFANLMKGAATRIVTDGAVDWRQARRANIGEQDLEEELRLRGIADAEPVEAAYLERNGKISVIRRPDREHSSGA